MAKPRKVTEKKVEKPIPDLSTLVESETDEKPEVEKSKTPEEKPLVEAKLKTEEKPQPLESPKNPVTKKKGLVTVEVLIGTLSWVGGSYEKGETFEIAKEELKKFDPRYYKILS